MWDVLDVAHPILSFTIVVVLLAALWMIHVLQGRLRVLESRLESLEREQRTMDDELELLSAAPRGEPTRASAVGDILSALGKERGLEPARGAVDEGDAS